MKALALLLGLYMLLALWLAIEVLYRVIPLKPQ
jgi:hypothetical protein